MSILCLVMHVFVYMPQNCYLALPSPDLCTPLATTDQDAVISCLISGTSKYFFKPANVNWRIV